MRIYYSNSEYEQGKHRILEIWDGYLNPPDIDNSSFIEIDAGYNRQLAEPIHYRKSIDSDLFDRYYVDGDGNLRTSDGKLVNINPNPQKQAYKLSQLYGLTHEQLNTYIDSNVTDLQSAREFVRKMAHVTLYLVKQTKLE